MVPSFWRATQHVPEAEGATGWEHRGSRSSRALSSPLVEAQGNWSELRLPHVHSDGPASGSFPCPALPNDGVQGIGGPEIRILRELLGGPPIPELGAGRPQGWGCQSPT